MKAWVFLVAMLALGCGSKKSEPATGGGSGSGGAGTAATGSDPGSAAPAKATRNELSRADFNRLAVRANLPLYWVADTNGDNNVDPDEVAHLLFYPDYAGDLDAAYQQLLAVKAEPVPDAGVPEGKRRALVDEDLDQGRPTLVRTDVSTMSAGERAFVDRMLAVAAKIDELYAIQNGSAALAEQLPKDTESHSLFRRNWGPACVAPATEKDPACTAIPGAPKPIVDVYPATVGKVAQTDKTFCASLEARPDAKGLLEPFTAVREVDGKLTAVPYSEAYKAQMLGVANELLGAAGALDDPAEQPLVDYLKAAAASFASNDWWPADEAWAKMNADNSKWYVRVGPDETYWEPCNHKAGFHLTFSRINQGSKAWQDKLVPVQQEMEAAIAAHAGAPYKAREVKFHLPDFIDIVVNAGDDRAPMSATIGQSLPNSGPVKDSSRGRTIAMVNLFTDDDSLATRHAAAATLLDTASMASYVDDPEPGLLSTILHEATHNLGPAGGYKVKGKTSEQVFGGQMASMLEELKAQTGALFLVELLRGKGLITDELAARTYADMVVWACGHIARGMYESDGSRKAYSQLAAIQVGFLLDKQALTWDPKATAANGTDTGAFTIHADKFVTAADELMKVVAGIMARGDRKGAEALAKKYVDGTIVPQPVIAERFGRFPKVSFVYAIAK